MKSRWSCLARVTPARSCVSLSQNRSSLHFSPRSHARLSLFSNHPYGPLNKVPSVRLFATTSYCQNWLAPKRHAAKKTQKGRCRVPTGGSTRGTTVVWGDYGLRLRDHDRRMTAKSLAIGADTIKKRLRGERFRLYTRVAANVAVFTRGSEVRMGKGKGSFDYWAARIAVSQIVFEISGECHEQVVRDAFRLAAIKMPGQYEFVKKGDPPMMGLTKMTEGMSLQDMKKPRRPLPADIKAGRLPASIPGPLPEVTAGMPPRPNAATPP